MCNRYQGEALYSVQSRYSKSKEDRRWKWRCKRIVSRAMSSCYWTGYQTNLNEPFLFHCPANYVLSGVKSVHFKKGRIGGGTSTAAEALDIVQNNATGQNTSTSGVVL